MPEDLNTRTNRKCSYCVTIGMLLFYQAQGACEGTLDTMSVLCMGMWDTNSK